MVIDKEYHQAVRRYQDLISQREALSEIAKAGRTVKYLEEDVEAHVERNLLGRIVQRMQDDSVDHSVRMELTSLLDMYDRNVPQKKRKEIRREIIRCRRNLQEAWRWGFTHYQNVDHDFIQGVAAHIDPELFQEDKAPYRNDNVRILGGMYTPPRAEKVPLEMQKLFADLERNGQFTPLEKAAYLHFHLVRIHPFPDANGRTSRMVQNIHLVTHSLPPAIIHHGERSFYNRLLEEAVGGHRERTAQEQNGVSPEERRFFNYIASKVLVGLDTITNTLARKKETH